MNSRWSLPFQNLVSRPLELLAVCEAALVRTKFMRPLVSGEACVILVKLYAVETSRMTAHVTCCLVFLVIGRGSIIVDQ